MCWGFNLRSWMLALLKSLGVISRTHESHVRTGVRRSLACWFLWWRTMPSERLTVFFHGFRPSFRRTILTIDDCFSQSHLRSRPSSQNGRLLVFSASGAFQSDKSRLWRQSESITVRSPKYGTPVLTGGAAIWVSI